MFTFRVKRIYPKKYWTTKYFNLSMNKINVCEKNTSIKSPIKEQIICFYLVSAWGDSP